MDALKAMLRKSGVTTISDMGTGIFAGFEMEAQMIRAAFEHPGNPSRVMLMPMANALAAEADPTAGSKALSNAMPARMFASTGGSRCSPMGPSLRKTCV